MPRGKALSDAEKAKREQEKGKKFKDIGSKRLNNALTAINRLAPLANRSQYSYTDEQVATIRKHLNESVERVLDGFKGGEAKVTGVTL